jgi:hypothetical protein
MLVRRHRLIRGQQVPNVVVVPGAGAALHEQFPPCVAAALLWLHELHEQFPAALFLEPTMHGSLAYDA